ncbi:MAG: hypothetical protein AAGJ37_06235 [Pseudomonadota bacterium]
MCNRVFLVLPLVLLSSGCINSDHVHSEYQIRMQRCEQYVGSAKERCLNGELITIEEYKDGVKDYKRKTEDDDK